MKTTGRLLPAIAVLCTGISVFALPRELRAQDHGDHTRLLHPLDKHKADWGYLVFDTTANSADAKAQLVQGVAALHDFLYPEARASFQKAQELEPGYFMAIVCEAMTYSYLLWGSEDIPNGRLVLAKLGKTPEERASKAPTEREGLYLAAVEELYTNRTRAKRLEAFADRMKTLSDKEPSDLETKAFYALSLLAIVNPEEFGYLDRAQGRLTPALNALADVYQANPRHPGALHYIIHAYDSPKLAIHAKPFLLGLKTCAPDASHQVHMPTHILLRLGDWKTSIDWNEESFYKISKETDFHTLSYLHYDYMQDGQFEKAKDALERMKIANDGKPGYREMKVRQVIELNQWDLADTKLPEFIPYEGNVTWANGIYASELYATGIAALSLKKDDAMADQVEKAFADLLARVAKRAADYTAAGDPDEARRISKSTLLTRVILEEFQGNRAWLAKKPALAALHLKKAIALEESLGPPTATLPFPMVSSSQLYAELFEQSAPKAEIKSLLKNLADEQPNLRRTNELLGRL